MENVNQMFERHRSGYNKRYGKTHRQSVAVRTALYLIMMFAVYRINQSAEEICQQYYQSRLGWDTVPYFNEEIDLTGIQKHEEFIQQDENILILLGSEQRLLADILSQHGIYDCLTPNAHIGSTLMQHWITMRELSKRGNRPAMHGYAMYTESHISKETMFDAYRAYFHRLLTWQNSERLCLILKDGDFIEFATMKYGGTNTTMFDGEILQNIFPGAKFVFVTSDPKRQVYKYFDIAVSNEKNQNSVDFYKPKQGKKRKKRVKYSKEYKQARSTVVQWGKSWTMYHEDVSNNCQTLEKSCRTIKIEDLILEADEVFGDLYDWLGVRVYDNAKFLQPYNPAIPNNGHRPMVQNEIAGKTFNMLIHAIKEKQLSVSLNFVHDNLAQILLIENLYYAPLSDLEGNEFDESGVSFANRRRDWLSDLNLDNTGYSIYSAATYHLQGDFRKVHDYITLHQNTDLVRKLRSYNFS